MVYFVLICYDICMNQSGFANIALIVLTIILAGAVGYFVMTRKQEPVTQQTTTLPLVTTQTLTPQTPTPTSVDETANRKTYRNEKYRFEVKYPVQWRVEDTKGSGGGKFLIVNWSEEQMQKRSDGGLPNNWAMIDILIQENTTISEVYSML